VHQTPQDEFCRIKRQDRRNNPPKIPNERHMNTPSHTRRLFVPLALALSASIGATLSGCIFVSEREVRYVDDDHADRSSKTPRGRLGVVIGDTSSSLAAQTGADRHRSCVLERIYAGSPADLAGLRPYDVVTHIDGRDYATPAALRSAIHGRRPGETLDLTIVRGGHPQNVSITVGPIDQSTHE
jgi:S1-C subfamily serine protease